MERSATNAGCRWHDRQHSLARRLLAGAGRLQVTAYDLDPANPCEALVHGRNRRGEFVVVGRHDPCDPVAGHDGTPLRVRLDLFKEAPEAAVRITSYSAHLLGTLRWLSWREAEEYRDGGLLEGLIADIAADPHTRVATVELSEAHLHEATGPLRLDLAALVTPSGPSGAQEFPDAATEWQARELLASCTGDELSTLMHHPDLIHLWTRPTHSCPNISGHTYCVDMDAFALTLMHVDEASTTAALLPFPGPVTGLPELAHCLQELMVQVPAHGARAHFR